MGTGPGVWAEEGGHGTRIKMALPLECLDLMCVICPCPCPCPRPCPCHHTDRWRRAPTLW